MGWFTYRLSTSLQPSWLRESTTHQTMSLSVATCSFTVATCCTRSLHAVASSWSSPTSSSCLSVTVTRPRAGSMKSSRPPLMRATWLDFLNTFLQLCHVICPFKSFFHHLYSLGFWCWKAKILAGMFELFHFLWNIFWAQRVLAQSSVITTEDLSRKHAFHWSLLFMGSGVYMTYTFYMDWHLRSCSKKRWSSPLYLSRSLVFFGSKYPPLYGEIVDITTNRGYKI